jgi:hypothetical protein
LGAGCEEEKMDDALREAKLAKLIEIEGYDSADELMEAIFSDAVSPAIKASSQLHRGCPMPKDYETKPPKDWTPQDIAEYLEETKKTIEEANQLLLEYARRKGSVH